MKVLYAEKQASLMKERAELEEQELVAKAAQERKRAILDTEMRLLSCKEEAAMADAEAKYGKIDRHPKMD